MIFGRFDDRIHTVHSPVQASADKDRPLREQIPAAGAGS
jgi:hypothetical protein